MLKTNLSYTVAVSESHMLGTELRNRAFDWRAHKALSSISSTTGEEEKKKKQTKPLGHLSNASELLRKWKVRLW